MGQWYLPQDLKPWFRCTFLLMGSLLLLPLPPRTPPLPCFFLPCLCLTMLLFSAPGREGRDLDQELCRPQSRALMWLSPFRSTTAVLQMDKSLAYPWSRCPRHPCLGMGLLQGSSVCLWVGHRACAWEVPWCKILSW